MAGWLDVGRHLGRLVHLDSHVFVTGGVKVTS